MTTRNNFRLEGRPKQLFSIRGKLNKWHQTEDIIDYAFRNEFPYAADKIIFIWFFFYLVPKGKQTANELPMHFASFLTLS